MDDTDADLFPEEEQPRENVRDAEEQQAGPSRIVEEEDEAMRIWGAPTVDEPKKKKRSSADVGFMMEGRGDERGVLKGFGSYMQLKKDKLRYQVNVLSRYEECTTSIFNGISIFVNGYTVPSLLELRMLIQRHGGEFHVYYEYGKTTYTVASTLAQAKQGKLRKEEKVIRPEFIVDSVAAGRLLDDAPYLLLKRPKEGRTLSQAWKSVEAKRKTDEEKQVAIDARNANFINEYYARSRLHLISTLAQEMRDYMNNLRDEMNVTEMERERARMAEELEESGGGGMIRRPAPREPVIFHVDLDCFFVSVALRSRPDLRGKAVAVTHSSGSKDANGFSEVASCSYEARANGVRNGCLVRDALRKCPELICVPYQFDDYRQVSKEIYRVIASLTLEVRAVSCDEMYVDATSLVNTMGSAIGPEQIGEYIRSRVKRSTGCTASIGVGPNPLVARLATRVAKPDGLKWVSQAEVDDFMATQKIADLPGVGYSTMEKLMESTGTELALCSELQEFSENWLIEKIGKKNGALLYRLCRGIDPSPVVIERQRKSVSCDINYGIRFTKDEELQQFLVSLVNELEKKLRQAKMKAGAMTLKVMVRAADAPIETAKYLGHGKCDTHTRCGRLEPPTCATNTLLEEAKRLMNAVRAPIADLRGIGLQLTRLLPLTVNARPSGDEIKQFFAPRPANTNTVVDKAAGAKEKERRAIRQQWMELMKEDETGGMRKKVAEFRKVDPRLVKYTKLHVPTSKLRQRPLLIGKAKFLGESTPVKVRQKIVFFMTSYEVNPRSIEALIRHARCLVERGEVRALREFLDVIKCVSCKPFALEGWRFAVRLIINKVKEMTIEKYEAALCVETDEEDVEMDEIALGAQCLANLETIDVPE